MSDSPSPLLVSPKQIRYILIAGRPLPVQSLIRARGTKRSQLFLKSSQLDIIKAVHPRLDAHISSGVKTSAQAILFGDMAALLEFLMLFMGIAPFAKETDASGHRDVCRKDFSIISAERIAIIGLLKFRIMTIHTPISATGYINADGTFIRNFQRTQMYLCVIQHTVSPRRTGYPFRENTTCKPTPVYLVSPCSDAATLRTGCRMTVFSFSGRQRRTSLR